MLISGALNSQDTAFHHSGMKFVLIKPGKFLYGKYAPPYAPADTNSKSENTGFGKREYACAAKLAKRDAMPGFEVKIEKAFYIGRFEVTQQQWKKIMGYNPSFFKGDDHPVDNVTWDQAQAFIKKLNDRDTSRTYRLPTEFEWEYAARAGAADDIAWSEIRLQAQIGTSSTNRVGQKMPNAWGCYDMLGNVWEWTQDIYNEKIFADPVPLKKGNQHVLKGASFTGDVKNATYMTHAAGPANGWDVGFRLVMEDKRVSEIAEFLPERVFDNIDAWHVSRSTHQGTTPDVKFRNGVITLKQKPYGQGGVLLSDKKYRDFELSLDVKIDSFCNGGIFLRSTESGQAYQVELSEPGGTGNLLGEMLRISKPVRAEKKPQVWKANEWNNFRIRMVGEVPRITLWINDELMWDVIQPRNDFVAGATLGMIGFQVHWSATFSTGAKAFDMSGSWRPGGKHMFRNVSIKDLTNDQ